MNRKSWRQSRWENDFLRVKVEVVEKGSVVWWCEVVGDGRVIAFSCISRTQIEHLAICICDFSTCNLGQTYSRLLALNPWLSMDSDFLLCHSTFFMCQTLKSFFPPSISFISTHSVRFLTYYVIIYLSNCTGYYFNHTYLDVSNV